MNQHAKMHPISAYFNAHKKAFSLCLSRFKLTLVTNLMTLIVITIALLLPTGLFLVLENLHAVSKSWDQGAQINLYLNNKVNRHSVDRLMNDLKHNPDIAEVKFISAEEGLKEFTDATETNDVVDNLDDNPLPNVIVITPKLSIDANKHMLTLRDQLEKMPQVLDAKIDNLWVKRLNEILMLLKKFLIGLSVILGAGVIFIVGNSVQYASQKYHKEIKLYKLVGATASYIRRPFLYTGLLYGAAGGLLTIMFIWLFMWWLKPEILQLESLYQHKVVLLGLNTKTSLILLLFASILGYVGAFVAISGKAIR